MSTDGHMEIETVDDQDEIKSNLPELHSRNRKWNGQMETIGTASGGCRARTDDSGYQINRLPHNKARVLCTRPKCFHERASRWSGTMTQGYFLLGLAATTTNSSG